MLKYIIPSLLAFLFLFSCSQEEKHVYKDIEKQLLTQFIAVADGGIIEIPEGYYRFKGSLSLEGKKNITIRGKGKDKTVLSWKGQKDGSEGFKITNGENILIENLTIQDTKGDGVKTQKIKGITFRNVKAEWTGEPNEKNGSYGFYPVDCDNVLVEGCESIGASDAGIYVGQSRNVVVRKCSVFHNVAGIEIENCRNAEVYDNLAEQNTGGILVFDMPGLTQTGKEVRVFKNMVKKNNFKNFAPKGNIVGTVPPGTGIMVVATNYVEIFDNDIVGNKTLGACVASFLISGFEIKDTTFDPYPKSIYIHDNRFKRGFRLPTLQNDMGKLLALRFWFWPPDVIYDGMVDPKALDANGKVKEEYRICVRNNGDIKVANVDAKNDFKGVNTDPKQFDCSAPNVAPIAFKPN
ncbi:MAG: parallel beta-helix domain-containing protein [Chitinophagales bacterium]|nr:parallel beta-helix domain-containing protein [Chitinophagales bacterium]